MYFFNKYELKEGKGHIKLNSADNLKVLHSGLLKTVIFVSMSLFVYIDVYLFLLVYIYIYIYIYIYKINFL